jgi:hypothetical protein
LGFSWFRKQATNDGGSDTGGLPRRTDKAQRKADQAKAARIERDSFSVPDRPGRPKGRNGYNYDRGNGAE